MFIICLRFVFVYLWPRHHKTPSKKYVNINGKVSKDKWQSMFRYLTWYIESLFWSPSIFANYSQFIRYHTQASCRDFTQSSLAFLSCLYFLNARKKGTEIILMHKFINIKFNLLSNRIIVLPSSIVWLISKLWIEVPQDLRQCRKIWCDALPYSQVWNEISVLVLA